MYKIGINVYILGLEYFLIQGRILCIINLDD